MATGNEKSASFSINLDGDLKEQAAGQADALRGLQDAITGSQDKIKSLGAAQRQLRGSTEEIKSAREQLKAKIESERQALSKNTLEILKQGTTYDKLSAQTKKLSEAKKTLDEKMKTDKAKSVEAAFKAAGGPAAELKDRLSSLSTIFTGAGGAAGALTFAAVGLVAAIAAVTAAAIAGGIALAKWIIEAADATRTSALQRESLLGNAEAASRFGDHLTVLSSKLSTPRAKLEELAATLYKTRLNGNEIVDVMNAVGQAAAGAGDDVGNAFKDILTRGALVQRLQINPFELLNSKVDFQDIAKELAVQTNVGIGEASSALAAGAVKLDVGAKAVRAAIEKRFGEINARKALAIGVQLEKFGANLTNLARDVKLEPALKALDELGKLFTDATENGKALRATVTILGDMLAKAFVAAKPYIQDTIDTITITGLEAVVAFLKLRNAARDAFKGWDIDLAQASLNEFLRPLKLVATAFDMIRISVETIDKASGTLKGVFGGNVGTIGAGRTSLGSVSSGVAKGEADGRAIGESVGNGMAKGMLNKEIEVRKAGAALGEFAKQSIVEKLEIHSPSRVFERYGAQTAAGYSKGVDGGADGAHASIEGMGSGMPGMSLASTRGDVTVNLTVNVGAGARPDAVAAIQKVVPSLRSQVTQLFEELLTQHGALAGDG